MTASLQDHALHVGEQQFETVVQRLERLVAIPSCSFPGFDPAQVEASAEATKAWLEEVGFPEVRILRLPGVHPYVLAKDHRAGAQAPTVALYAHHDVQPPLREELWRTPPFTPTRVHDRLHGRGAADDKGGIAVHAASAWAWNQTTGHPPVNLTVIVEGEEEIGSPNFSRFLDRYLDELACDCVVIADLQNFATGLPSLTTSLRGLVAIELEVRALSAPLHSGMWGGAVPDPALLLSRLLASLTDHQGSWAVPGLTSAVRPPSASECAAYRRLPYDRREYAAQAGIGPAVLPEDGATLYRRLWREPSLAINVLQAGSRGQTGNVVMDGAWARFGIRIVPDMQAHQTFTLVERHLRGQLTPEVAAGVTLTISPVSLGEPWATPTDHPIFAVACQALRVGYGREPVLMGCGASIPFVGEFTARLGGIPALLVGVEDPSCAAHAENESLHLGDLRSAIRAQTAFFDLLASQRHVIPRLAQT